MTDNNQDFYFDDEEVNPRQGVVKAGKQIEKVKKTAVDPEVEASRKALELDRKQVQLIDIYRNEEKVPVRIAPSYAAYFGKIMRVSINGISVGVRCDGTTMELPASFAAVVEERMLAVDSYERKLSRMSDVKTNMESNPGQLNFFG